MNKKLFHYTVTLASRYPRHTIWISVLITLLLAISFPSVKVDTDPESMLANDNPARVYHNDIKAAMDLYGMIVVAVTRDEHENGVFNPESLERIKLLVDYIVPPWMAWWLMNY